MSDTPKRSFATLIASLIALVVSSINTQRTDVEELKKQKAEADSHIKELEAKLEQFRDELEEENIEDAELEALRPQIENLLSTAQAAKPPTEAQVKEVGAATPPETPEQKE